MQLGRWSFSVPMRAFAVHAVHVVQVAEPGIIARLSLHLCPHTAASAYCSTRQ